MNRDHALVAYFSMEIGLEPDVPTYAGGLGMLAGDTVRAAADQGIAMVAVSLLYRRGYFHQHLDAEGRQSETDQLWQLDERFEELSERCEVEIEGRSVLLRAWRYLVRGVSGQRVPVLLLDADLPENSPWDRTITHCLYGGDEHYRLCQEVVLGLGGVRILRSLGYESIRRFHMNEGHAAMLVLELLDQQRRALGRSTATREDADAVHERCVFTTHTPVAAGHDQFPIELVRRVLGGFQLPAQLEGDFCQDGRLNMTYLALANSRYVNGVAKRHRETAQLMFAPYLIDSITNGVHAGTWVCRQVRELFDRYIPGWESDNPSLRYAITIPREAIRNAHQAAKKDLLAHIEQTTDVRLDPRRMTIGFARRATPYKRFDLLFHDIDRLKEIAKCVGSFQLVFAGKAHPADTQGKTAIQKIFHVREQLRGTIDLVYLEDYDMAKARLMTAGCDLWLNTPQPPLEASGTSGMKAALNGVPTLSVLDGWWIEGCVDDVTGWALDSDYPDSSPLQEAKSLYDKLEHTILPAFYAAGDGYEEIMLHAIAFNGSFFNAERMLNQYVTKAYFG